jgi:hypothetical protein
VRRTRIVCNPKGYGPMRAENAEFDVGKVVKV